MQKAFSWNFYFADFEELLKAKKMLSMQSVLQGSITSLSIKNNKNLTWPPLSVTAKQSGLRRKPSRSDVHCKLLSTVCLLTLITDWTSACIMGYILGWITSHRLCFSLLGVYHPTGSSQQDIDSGHHRMLPTPMLSHDSYKPYIYNTKLTI